MDGGGGTAGVELEKSVAQLQEVVGGRRNAGGEARKRDATRGVP